MITEIKSISSIFRRGFMLTKQFSAINSISAAEKNGPVPSKMSLTGPGSIPLKLRWLLAGWAEFISAYKGASLTDRVILIDKSKFRNFNNLMMSIFIMIFLLL